jgi:hypothetical protein
MEESILQKLLSATQIQSLADSGGASSRGGEEARSAIVKEKLQNVHIVGISPSFAAGMPRLPTGEPLL